MERILGLDLGVNSIGWALVEIEEEGEEGKRQGRIVDMGVVIPFPGNQDVTQFEKGEQLEQNKNRRSKRMMRRLLYRKKRRKEMIRLLAEVLGYPDFLNLTNSNGQGTKSIYEDRVRGLKEQIPMDSFLRILYLYAHRRGISHTLNASSQKIPVKAKILNGNTIQILNFYFERKLKNKIKNGEEYKVEIKLEKNKKLTEEELKTLIGKECFGIVTFQKKAKQSELIPSEFQIEFQSEEEVVEFIQKSEEAKKNGEQSKRNEYEKANLYTKLLLGQQKPGEFLMQLLDENKEYKRIRGIVFHREDYLAEFDELWDKQAEFYPELSDAVILDTYRKRLIEKYQPRESVRRMLTNVKSLKELVRDWVIFYQRPLKKAIGRGKCRYERGRTTIARSHPLYQIFRLWQSIQNLAASENGKITKIGVEEKWKLFFDILLSFHKKSGSKNDLESKDIEKILNKSIKSKVKIPIPKTFWDILISLSSLPELVEKIKEETKGNSELLWQAIETHPVYQIWHLLYSSYSEEQVRKGLQKVLKKLLEHYQLEDKFSDEEIEAVIYQLRQIYEQDSLEKGYGSLSARAIRKLLRLMVPGEMGKGVLPHPELSEDKRKEIQFKLESGEGLLYNEAATWLYGDFRAQYGEPYTNPDQLYLTLEDHKKIRHPIVKGLVSATLRLIKEIWKTYGKPDRIHVEFARELRSSPERRKKIQKEIEKSENENKKIRGKIKEEGLKSNLSNIRKYKLWEEANHQCLYCGEKIGIAELEQIQLEHVIPKSVLYNNSYVNLVIACQRCNAEKGDWTGFDYMISKGMEDFHLYLERIRNLSGIKEKVKNESSSSWKQLLASYLYTYSPKEKIEEIFPGDEEWRNLLEEWRKGGKRKRIELDSYWERKLWHLLASVEYGEEELLKRAEFLENQLQATRYASTSIRPYLERVTPGKVLITTGGVTAYLRDDHWKLNEKVWQKLVEPYYKILGEDHLRSKRDDHRNHALDALVIALTTHKEIHNLNSYKGKGGKGKLPKPIFPFQYTDVLEKLKEIVVFYRHRRRVKSRWKGRVSIRGKLHGDTLYGLRLVAPISGSDLEEYLHSVVFKNNQHVKWLKIQWELYQWWKKIKSESDTIHLKDFWNLLWKDSKESPLYLVLQRDGMGIIENGALNNLDEEGILKNLTSKVLIKLRDKKCDGISLTRFAIVKRTPLSKLKIEVDNKGKYKISKILIDTSLKKELETFLNEEEIQKFSLDAVQKFNKIRIQKRKPIVQKVRVERSITSLSSFEIFLNKPNHPVVELESSYVAYGKEQIFTLYHILKGSKTTPQNSSFILHQYDLILVKQEKDIEELVQTGNLIDRLFVVTSIKPSNDTTLIRHHSFSNIERTSLSLNSIERVFKVSWLGKIEEVYKV